MALLDNIRDGRTDLVFEYLAAGHPADSADKDGVTLVGWCGLLAAGANLNSLGHDLGLNAWCFHRHWRLTNFLIERGADVNRPEADTGETPLPKARRRCIARQPWRLSDSSRLREGDGGQSSWHAAEVKLGDSSNSIQRCPRYRIWRRMWPWD